MGREARCTARLDGESSSGKALLETDELLFRGAFRAAIPFRAMTRIEADAQALTIVWPGGTLVLALGADAAKWAARIRNPPSLLDKLGIKAGMRIALLGIAARDRALAGALEARGARIDGSAGRGAGPVDVLFLSAERRAELGPLPKLKKRIAPDGAIWVIRPKGGKELTEGDVRSAGRAAGLVDVKVAAFSATHSAAKLVIPVAERRPPAGKPTGKPAGKPVGKSSPLGSALRAPRARARSPDPDRSTT